MMLPKKFLAKWKFIAVLAAVVLTSIGAGRVLEERIAQWYGDNRVVIEGWLDRITDKSNPEVAGDKDEQKQERFLVVEVIDGDTVKVKIDSEVENVRLLGIDAPEMNDKNMTQACFARLAKQKLSEKLTGKRVKLEIDQTQGDRDRYERLLRDVYVEEVSSGDLVWINGWLVREGLAAYYARYPVSNSETLRLYENEARGEYKGLWSGRCL